MRTPQLTERPMAKMPDKLTAVGTDLWSRDLFNFKNENGAIIPLVDVDGELHTMTNKGEPKTPTGIETPNQPNKLTPGE